MPVFPSSLCSTINQELMNDYTPVSTHWVKVTHVENPSKFYVLPVKYERYLRELEENLKPTVSVGANHQRYIIYKPKDRVITNYIRGTITTIYQQKQPKTCDIFALDYGFFEQNYPLEETFCCETNVANMPPLAIRCQLANCVPNRGDIWSKESIEALLFYFGNDRAKMVVLHKIGSNHIVEIFNSCPDDIATLMALTGYSNMGMSNNMVNRFTANGLFDNKNVQN